MKTNFIGALSKCIRVPDFNPEQFTKKLNKHSGLLRQCRAVHEYIELIELIYNYATKTEKLYLAAEIDKAMRSRAVHTSTRTGAAN
jgi:hypothetical protein